MASRRRLAGPRGPTGRGRRAAEALGVHVRVQLGLAESAAVRLLRGPRGARPRSFANIAPSWCWVSAKKRRWPRPTIGRRCRSPTPAVFYARLTKWDEYFDDLPVHTISAQLYYTLAFSSLEIAAGGRAPGRRHRRHARHQVRRIRCYATQFPPAKEYVYRPGSRPRRCTRAPPPAIRPASCLPARAPWARAT